MTADRTALSYWFPIVEAAGLPVPRTIILDMPRAAQAAVWAVFDGREDGDIRPFADEVHHAASTFGYPCFLRTDHTAGKHDWSRTCFLDRREDIASHIFAIAEYSEMAGVIGLPWMRWAVRELLPTKVVGICQAYGGMPICREFRFFVTGGHVDCRHPYWPEDALAKGGAIYRGRFDYDAFCRLSAEEDAELSVIASRAGEAVGGSWSVDLLETERGWFLTDMAEAHKSFHWDECPSARRRT